MDLSLETRSLGDISVVRCNGRVVFNEEANFLCDTVSALLQKGQYLVLNFCRVTAVDARGLGTLVACIQQARELGRTVVLCNLSRHVLEVAQLTRLDEVVDICDSEEEAIETCRALAA